MTVADALRGLRAFSVPGALTLFTIGTLALLCGLQALALARAPAAWLPAAIDIALAPNDTLTLGQRELAAPQTDRQHISLLRDARGAWWLRNLSPNKQVILLRGDDEQRMGSQPLRAGQRFQVDSALFEVGAADADTATFTRAGHSWRYDGAVLYRDGRQQADCPDARLSARALSAWNRIMPLALTVARPLSFGGNLACDNRLGLPRVAPGAAQLARSHGRLRLSAGNPDGDRAAVLVHDGERRADLAAEQAPLAGVSALIIGHTRFQLTAQGEHLTLRPGRHVTLFQAPEQKLPPQVSWQWRQRAPWDGSPPALPWPLAAACVLILWGHLWSQAGLSDMSSSILMRRRQWRWRPPLAHGIARAGRHAMPAAAACLLAAGVAALVAQRAGQAPGAAYSLMLGACASLLWLALPGRPTLLTAAGVTLLAAGLLAQLELGLGAPESSWLRYYQKSAAMLAIGAGLGGLLRLWALDLAARGARLRQRGTEWLLAIFAAVALAALAAQVLWGDETGVFDLQPVELAKLALTALTAHCLALRFGWHEEPARGREKPAERAERLTARGEGLSAHKERLALRRERLAAHGGRWLRLIAPALLFLALLGVSLVQVDDFSPLILLLVWSTVTAFAYALAARERALAGALVLMALLAAGAVAYLRWVGTDDLIRWGFYSDRFLVWLNPAEHPHTGQQLLLGARAVAEGGWLGADQALGLRSLGMPAGDAMRIPAVQDDFAASFFLNRHGLAGGLLLWCAQAAFLAGIALAALRAHRDGAAARDFRQAWSGRFRYFALCGGGAFVLGHFLLSWGTNLAIFPIMGQPMSFLSAGGSHLLFFLCPLLTLGAASAPFLEESPSCRSMYNTKS